MVGNLGTELNGQREEYGRLLNIVQKDVEMSRKEEKKEIALIYPNQLFKDINEEILNSNLIVIVEDPLFFGDKKYPAKFHKQKLIFHRISMKKYEKYLASQFDSTIDYFDYSSASDISDIVGKNNIAKIITYEPNDYILEKRLKRIGKAIGIEIRFVNNPSFLLNSEDIENYIRSSKSPYFHAEFYKWQRKRMDLLIDDNGDPVGGSWSYDTKNRKPYRDDIEVPTIDLNNGSDNFAKEAKIYVEEHFTDNPGDPEILYPTDHKSAREWLDVFCTERLNNFGPFEDAISKQHNYLFHSVITPMLNVGLLTPREVIDKVIDYSSSNDIPLESLEGFIRQIIGWREFMRLTYLQKGSEMRNSNFFNHSNSINERFYSGSTGLTPFDDNVIKLNQSAYSHHIIRLMVFGNFFLLTEVDPKQTYLWFMEMFIDSYDWVMVPNVYGMSQFSDGGSIVTKPYFSGSNYIKKMSDYKGNEDPPTDKGKEIMNKLIKEFPEEKINWAFVWDGLFWRFIKMHRDFLKKNARMGFITNSYSKYENKIKVAEKYLQILFD